MTTASRHHLFVLALAGADNDPFTPALGLHNVGYRKYWRDGSGRGVATTNLREQEHRTQPGIHAAVTAQLRY